MAGSVVKYLLTLEIDDGKKPGVGAPIGIVRLTAAESWPVIAQMPLDWKHRALAARRLLPRRVR